MKRAILVLAAGGILGAVTLCVAAAAPGSESSEIAQLKKQVEILTQRVDALEQKLNAGLPFTVPRGRVMPPGIIEPNSLPGFLPVPRNWRRFEFNGRPYYMVPVDSSAAGPAPEIKK